MSLSAVLVKPQVLAQPPANVKGDELQLIADLIRALTRNPQVAQVIGDVIVDELHNQMRTFLVSREERLRFVYGKGRNIFSPFETAINTLISDLQDDILEAIPTILSLSQQVVAGLSLNSVKAFIGDLWDLAENDLEISADTLRQLVDDLFAGVIARLQQPFNGGDSSDDAIAQYDFGCTVDNLRAFVMDELVIPRIDKQLVLEAVTKIWQQYKIDENLQIVSQVLAASEEIIEPLSEIAQCIIRQIETSSNTDRNNPGPFTDRSAEWDSVRSPNNDSSDTTSPADENTTMAWYASWVAGKNVKYSSDTTQPLNIYDNPELMGFTYENVSRETMERIAFHTAWIVPVLETIPHFASLEKGDIWSNLTNIFANGIDSVLIGWPKFNLPKWAHWAGLPIYTLLAGFEGHEGRWEMPWDDDPYIWTNMLGDLGEAYMYRRISWTAREALLSVLTLINNNQEEAQTWREQALRDAERETSSAALNRQQVELAWIRRNNNCFHGLAYFFGELLVMMVPGIISATDKKNYGFIGGGPGTQIWVCGFVGAAVTWAIEYLFGAMFGRELSGEWFNNRLRFAFLPLRERSVRGLFFSDLWGSDEFIADLWRRTAEQSWWEIVLLSLPMGLYTALFGGIGMGMRVVDSLLYLYLFTDGDTEDGTYCIDPNGMQHSFLGYPDASTSPYLLPWESGTDKQCVQNNMGIWSHYPDDQQTYAYDFSHNMGDLVLCSRAGVVRAARDSTPSHGAAPAWPWNFIEIIHVIVIPPGATPPTGVTPHPQINSPYTGPRAFTDSAPVAVPPGGMQQYPGTTADIPLDVVFPVYPDGSSPPYRQSAAFPIGTSFSFIDPAHDRGIRGRTFLAGSTFNDGSPILNNEVFAPDTVGQPVPGTDHPEGTTFIPSTAAGVNFAPLTATFGVYGHGQEGFIPRVFGTPGMAANHADEILGEFVRQGQAIMEADDTGMSAYNHLHMHVIGVSQTTFTIPFVYKDKDKDKYVGQAKAMNYYTSTNERVT